MPLVILIHGLKYHGKSTLALKLLDYVDSMDYFIGNPRIYSLATPLKRQLAFKPGYDDPYTVYNELYDPVKKEKYRKDVTSLADETKSTKGERCYANQLISEIKHSSKYDMFSTPVPIVDDIRYDYEIEAFKDAGYNTFTVKILRPGQINEVTHSSELGLPTRLFDYFMLNTFEGLDDPSWKYEVERLIMHWRYTCIA